LDCFKIHKQISGTRIQSRSK